MKVLAPLALALAAWIVAPIARAQPLAFVQAGGAGTVPLGASEGGSAWLFHRGLACFAVTPLHVLRDPGEQRDSRYAALFVARPGAPPSPAQGDRCAVWPEQDLALMRVSGLGDLASCGQVFVGQPALDGLLSSSVAQVSLSTVVSSGRINHTPLDLRFTFSQGGDFFHVVPRSERDAVRGGQSGGLVTIDGKVAGILLDVPSESEGLPPGTARILRMDRVGALLARAFTVAGSMQTEVNGCLATVPAAIRPAAVQASRASAACGARTHDWSAAPVSGSSRPENLTDEPYASTVWRAPLSDELKIDLELCPSTRSDITSVRLNTRACEVSDNQEVTVEVLARSGPQASFITFGFVRMPSRSDVVIGVDVPIPAASIRLRFVRSQRRGASTVCLGPLEIR